MAAHRFFLRCIARLNRRARAADASTQQPPLKVLFSPAASPSHAPAATEQEIGRRVLLELDHTQARMQ